MDYWEDRLAANGKIDAYEKAIKAFRRSKKDRNAQNKAYDALQACGITGEEADEMLNLEMGDS